MLFLGKSINQTKKNRLILPSVPSISIVKSGLLTFAEHSGRLIEVSTPEKVQKIHGMVLTCVISMAKLCELGYE